MEHYFTQNPKSRYKEFKLNVALKEDSFEIISASGLFSRDELDSASKLLIESAELPNEGSCLDIGCGCGVIGIALNRRIASLNFVFSDINERALYVTRKNLKSVEISGKVTKSDIFSNIADSFDLIVSNPPMAAGRKKCYELIDGAFSHLNKNGSLQIVARHNKGGSMLEKRMNEIFGNVSILAKKSGFRVYKSVKE